MFWWLAQNTLIATLLALAVNVACRGRCFSPAVRHALWLAVLLKLVTPPLLCYSLPPLWPTTEPDAPAARSTYATVAPAETLAQLPEIGSPSIAVDSAQETALPGDAGDALAEAEWIAAAPAPFPLARELKIADDAPSAELLSSSETGGSWLPAVAWAWSQQALVAVWLLGTAAVVVVQAVRLVRFHRLLARTAPGPAWLASLVERAAETVGVAAPQVRVTEAACPPLVCALGRPKLLWPASLSDQLTGDSRRAVIVHELAHLRRRDHWVGWLELAAGCAWWWNPLFWYVRHQLREHAELACDAWVVAVLPRGRRAYAQALIEVSELVSWTAAPVPAVGMASRTRRTFERRLTMILRERISCRAPRVGLAAIALLAIAALPGWTIGQVPEPDDKSGVALTPPTGAPAPDKATPADADEVRVKLDPEASGDVQFTAAPPGRDEKLEQLESQLVQLLAEVKALRGQQNLPPNGSAADPFHAGITVSREGQPDRISARIHGAAAAGRALEYHRHDGHLGRAVVAVPHRAARMAAESAFVGSRSRVKVDALTRARYTLPPATAEALAKFIGEYVKADVDVKIVPPAAGVAPAAATVTLVVTASHEDQERIGAFIDLLSPAPTTSAAAGPANPAAPNPSDGSANNSGAALSDEVIEFVPDGAVFASPLETGASALPTVTDEDAPTILPEKK